MHPTVPYFSMFEYIALAVIIVICLTALLARIITNLDTSVSDALDAAMRHAHASYAQRIAMGYSRRDARAHVRGLLHSQYNIEGAQLHAMLTDVLTAYHKGA